MDNNRLCGRQRARARARNFLFRFDGEIGRVIGETGRPRERVFKRALTNY